MTPPPIAAIILQPIFWGLRSFLDYPTTCGVLTGGITEAVPITIPSPVSSDRTGLARSAWALNRRASPRNTSRPALA